MPSAIPCTVSPLISRIHSCLFSDWRRTASSKGSSISTEKLLLPCHARCVLSRLRCNEHSLLLSSYLIRIGRIENSSCSACGHSSQDTSHLILHCPATNSLHRSLFGDSLFFYNLWSRPWGSCPTSWAPWCSAIPLFIGRGRVTTTTITFTDNLMFIARYFMKHWEFQAIGNATYSVDSFFFLSGLLVAYLGLRTMSKTGGRMNVPLMYLFRYLRFVAAVVICTNPFG